MDDDRRFVLEFLAGQLVFVAALTHLTIGFVDWLELIAVGILVPFDVLDPLFVVSGAGLILGTYYASTNDVPRRPAYAAGIVAMLGYVVSYFGWHLLGHRPYIFFGPAASESGVLTVEWFLDHLLADAVVFGSILVEVAAVVVLTVLLVTHDG